MPLDVLPEVPEALRRAWAEEDAATDWEAMAAEWPDPDETVMHAGEHPGDLDDGPADHERLAAAMARTVHPADLLLLAEVDPAALPTKKSQLTYAQRADHVAALAASLQASAHVALAGEASTGDYLAEQHVELEIALARRVGEGTAGRDVELGRALSTTFPAFHQALARGEVSLAHCRRLVEATRPVVDPVALEIIGRLALPLARTLTPGRFSHRLRLLIETHDPDAAARRKRARTRDVWIEKLDNGLGRLVYTDDWPTVSAVFERLRKTGRDLQIHRKRNARKRREDRATGAASGAAGSDAGTPASAASDPAPSAAAPSTPAPTGARPRAGQPTTTDVEPARGHEPAAPTEPSTPTGRDGEELVVPSPRHTGPASEPATDLGGAVSEDDVVDPDAGTAVEDRSSDDDDVDGEEPDVSAGGCRADALLALSLGKRFEDGTIELDLSEVFQVQVSLVVPLSTLREESEHAALLAGMPVPAEEARDWERKARTYRRFVTDDVVGHVLDRGRQYNADDVREFVLHRDGCRIPVCTINRHDRLQADHAVPHPEGPTSSANMGGLSITHHQLKTAGYLDITDSKADGSCVITTRWGQRIVVPPRPFLHLPEPPDDDVAAPSITGPPGAPPPAASDEAHPNAPDDDIPPF